MRRKQSWVVPPELKNLSPYRFLCRSLEEVRPGMLRQLLREGGVRVDGEQKALNRPLKVGALVDVVWPDELYQRASRKQVCESLVMLYQDDQILVIDKPAGIPVVPDRHRNSPTVFDLLPKGVARHPDSGMTPKLAHRLDKHTSGALLIARDRDAKRDLTRAFQEHLVHKEYLALVRGVVRQEDQTVEAAIGKDRRHAVRMVIDQEHGKPAVTRIRVEETFDGFTLLRVSPITGRTHQIRVHLAHIGFPILGDGLYGGRPQLFLSDLKRSFRPKAGRELKPVLDRQALHCEILEFDTMDGVRQRVRSELPSDLQILLKHLRRYRPARELENQ
ncbi:MAG: RluA family pseudouridine synthase [Planctomycetota bacterium]